MDSKRQFLQILTIMMVGVTAVFGTVFALQAAPQAAASSIPDPTVHYYISALDAEKPEGGSGTISFTFMITRSGLATGGPSATVDFEITSTVTVSPQFTVDAADFGGIFPSGTISVGQQTREYTVTVPISGDNMIEFDESFQIVMSNPTYADGHIIQATANGIIQNDDYYLYLPFTLR